MKKDFVARETAAVFSMETQTRLVIHTKSFFFFFFFFGTMLMLFQNEILVFIMT